MTAAIAVMLFGAGVLAGIVNAVAGGATLFTFPTLMAAGLSPIVANASNALAVMPGNVMAVLSDRSSLPRRGHHMGWLLLISVVGGLAGALLLLATSERVFTKLVPALIGGATLLFAYARQVQEAIRTWVRKETLDQHPNMRLVIALLVPASVYGGYFGAGLGIMLMSVFVLGGFSDLRRANALKNLLSAMCAVASVSMFIWQGVISWPATIVMLVGASFGGIAGGRLIKVLPAAALRRVIILVGAVLSVVYASRYWF